MAPVFKLTMHPASEGDCATLEWGEASAPRRALVDLGRTKDYRALLPELKARKSYDLFVITHVDADHIEGAMPLVRADAPSFDPGDVWFNAYHHLIEARDRAQDDYEAYGAVQGEKLSAGILKFNWRARWNKAFAGRVVSINHPAAREPIKFGDIEFTLISPDDEKLAALVPRWLDELEKANLRPLDPDLVQEDGEATESFAMLDVDALARQPFNEDTAAPNGSSIAFLARFDRKCVLMPGDAHPGLMAKSLRDLGATTDDPMPIDLFKVSHHGSQANTSPELLSLVDCRRYAFSTDGTRHDHPDAATIARILKQEERRRKARPQQERTELIFNFRQPRTACWDIPALKDKHHYDCVFPGEGESGVTITI
ncbi:hypothetical protein QO058_30245 (plasmid) [Bosea vestrisii]|uniref:hypothetical protein n=1 Tax=Bosea vestrisii TaxID=151416 RepID=UPI0024DF63C6|nr:hypothetical protein [Bosea vestrisii]WID99683.1 hypothetical protein QO058_30245 [Bosea vestrisii]